MKFSRFEEIQVWKDSRNIVKEIYSLTENSKFSKDYALRDQIRKSAISVPSNIAEGYERKSNIEFIRFLFISKGSAGELRTQLYLAYDLKYIDKNDFDGLITKIENISKELSGFIKYLQKSI